MNTVLHSLVVTLLLASAVSSAAYAQERSTKRPLSNVESSTVSRGLLKTPGSSAAGGLSLRQAMSLAREDTGGRVLSSKSFNSGSQGVQIHQIRLLVDGERVITVVVDAKGRLRRR